MVGTRILVIIACWTTTKLCLCPTRESLDFLVKLRNDVCELRCSPGECKTAEVGAREQPVIGVHDTCYCAALNGHLPALKYLHENGCPWDSDNTCFYAAHNKHWDCLQYAVDNKCPGWEEYAKNYARVRPHRLTRVGRHDIIRRVRLDDVLTAGSDPRDSEKRRSVRPDSPTHPQPITARVEPHARHLHVVPSHRYRYLRHDGRASHQTSRQPPGHPPRRRQLWFRSDATPR